MVECRFSGSIISSNPTDRFDGCLQFIAKKERKKNFRKKRKPPSSHILPKSNSRIHSPDLLLPNILRFGTFSFWLDRNSQHSYEKLSRMAKERSSLLRSLYVHPFHHFLIWTVNHQHICVAHRSVSFCAWLGSSLLFFFFFLMSLIIIQSELTPAEYQLVHNAVSVDDDPQLGVQVSTTGICCHHCGVLHWAASCFYLGTSESRVSAIIINGWRLRVLTSVAFSLPFITLHIYIFFFFHSFSWLTEYRALPWCGSCHCNRGFHHIGMQVWWGF